MYRELTRASLVLAVMLMMQSLRLVLPLPAFVSMFVIGSIVNACLLMSLEVAGWRLALLAACIAPVVAYIQQALPLPVLILPVVLANIAYMAGYLVLRRRSRWGGIALATVSKVVLLWIAVGALLQSIELPAMGVVILRNMLGGAQIVTGLAGGILCIVLVNKLQKINRLH